MILGGIVLDIIQLHRNFITRHPSRKIFSRTNRKNGDEKYLGKDPGGISSEKYKLLWNTN